MEKFISVVICILLFFSLFGCGKKSAIENIEEKLSSNTPISSEVNATKVVLNTEIPATPLPTSTDVVSTINTVTFNPISMKSSKELAEIYNLSIEIVDIVKGKNSKTLSNPKILESYLEDYSKGKQNILSIEIYNVLKKRYKSKEISLEKSQKLHDEGYSILDMTMSDVLSYYCKKSSEEILVIRGKDPNKKTWESVSKQINVNYLIIPKEFRDDPTVADVQVQMKVK